MKTQLTIVDYLNRGRSNVKPEAKAKNASNNPQQLKTFENILNAAAAKQGKTLQTAPVSGSIRGRSLTDYWNHPILSPCLTNTPPDTENKENSAEDPAKISLEGIAPPTGNDPEVPISGIEGKAQQVHEKSEIRQKIDASIAQASQKYDVSEDLIRGIVRAESGFKPHVVSSAGAQGLMQLMPETAKELGVNNPYDIEENIDGGVRYFKQMMEIFNGDIKLSLAAYNAGPGAVRRHDGIPPYKETQNYVRKVMKFSKLTA